MDGGQGKTNRVSNIEKQRIPQLYLWMNSTHTLCVYVQRYKTIQRECCQESALQLQGSTVKQSPKGSLSGPGNRDGSSAQEGTAHVHFLPHRGIYNLSFA